MREMDALSVSFLPLDEDFVYLHNPSTEFQHPTCWLYNILQPVV